MAEVANLGALLPPLTGPVDPASYKKSLESSLQEAKLELQKNVDGNVANIVEGLRLASSFHGEVNAIRGELSQLQKTTHDPNVGLGALCKAHDETKQNLTHEIRRKTLAGDMGRHLVTAKDKMKLYDDKIAALNWTAASEALHAASTALHAVRVLIVGAVDPHQSHEIHQNHRFPKVYHILREQWRSRVESMRVTIAAAVDKIVEVSEDIGGASTSIIVRKSTDGRLSIFELFRCVGMCNLLDTACNTISAAIEPFLLRLTAEDFAVLQIEPEQETASLSTLKISTAISPKQKHDPAKKIDAATQLQHTRRLFKNTVAAFTFLWKHFAVTEAVPGAEDAWRRIAHTCFAAAQKQIIKNCLAVFVPDHSSDLVAYQDIVKETDIFETQLFDAKILPSATGQHQTRFDTRGLSAFARQVDVHFAQKSRKQIIDAAREVLLRDNALTESVHIEELSRGSESSLFEFPSCKVRKVAIELVQIADKTLKDALHQTALGSESMYQCVRAIFDLYRAIVPVQIRSKEDEVPMLALLVHNDCMYLSHQLLTLAQRYKYALPSSRKQSGDMTFLDLIVEYRKMAEKYFFQYMQAKKRDIQHILASAGGLADTGDEARYSAVQSALRQTQHELSRIAKLSQDVLPMIVFNQSFGALVDVATTWMVERLQELWDVSEEETHRLFVLFSSLDKLEDVFTDPTTPITEYVPTWSKMKKLGLMLEMKMVQIVEQFNAGEFYEFTADEIASLIRALFSDSDFRKTQLKLLKRK
eukprot:TRINITY_DN6565_c0_g2_i1.p1 TRINITY_DN6565_c0_g2~~TRINITY_DN6565_c0_g2_i1.p1  ORF type:complete len:758 (+),score=131.25 TRINITY_DN6565_c0_g2_i1:63-2336(+)